MSGSGSFVVPEIGGRLHYRPTTSPWAIDNGFAHELLWPGSNRVVYIKIENTRVKMIVDLEDYVVPEVLVFTIQQHEVQTNDSSNTNLC